MWKRDPNKPSPRHVALVMVFITALVTLPRTAANELCDHGHWSSPGLGFLSQAECQKRLSLVRLSALLSENSLSFGVIIVSAGMQTHEKICVVATLMHLQNHLVIF